MTQSNTNLRFAIYARKSSESDERQVESIEDQVKAMKEVAARESLRVIKTYSEAHSAKAPGIRSDYYDLIDDLKRSVVDAILTWSVDRLSRNPVDSGQLSWMLQLEELRLIKTPLREYRPEDNVVIFAVEGASANQQIIELRRNVKRGLQGKAERGVWPLTPPAGYRSVEVVINNRTRHNIDVDAQRFVLLRRAWDLMLTGAYTVPQIQQRLNAWGYRSRRTKRGRGLRPMSRSGLYMLFNNPFYYGCYRYNETFYQGTHKPMVSQSEFDEVQRLLGRKGTAQPQSHQFAFTGIIRCGICGGMVTAERHIKYYKMTGNTRHYVYYHCCGKSCRHSVTEAYIEEEIARHLASCQIRPALTSYIEEVLKRDLEDYPIVGLTVHNERRIRLGKLRKRLNTIYEMREGNEITSVEFADRKARCISEIHEIEAELKDMETQRERSLASVQNALHYLEEAYRRFKAGDLHEKRQVAILLAKEYTLTLGKLEIRPHPVLDALRSLEPPARGSHMVLTAQPTASLSAMSASLNRILTLVTGENDVFPELPRSGEVPAKAA